MSYCTQRNSAATPSAVPFALAAVLAAAFVAATLTAAHAQTANAPAKPEHSSVQTAAAVNPTTNRTETVEQRIAALHARLKITPDEDTNWNNVAQAMRDNATAMDKLSAEKATKPPQNMTALDDLKTYQEFAQTHVDGLKNLTSSFETLYDSMPDQQKKVADKVFQNFGHKNAPARS